MKCKSIIAIITTLSLTSAFAMDDMRTFDSSPVQFRGYGAAGDAAAGHAAAGHAVPVALGEPDYLAFYQTLNIIRERSVFEVADVQNLRIIFGTNFDPENFSKTRDAVEIEGVSLAQRILLNHYAREAFHKLNDTQFVEVVAGREEFFKTAYGFSFIHGWMLNKFSNWKHFDWNYKAMIRSMIDHLAAGDDVKNTIKNVFLQSGNAVNSNEFLFAIHSVQKAAAVAPVEVVAEAGAGAAAAAAVLKDINEIQADRTKYAKKFRDARQPANKFKQAHGHEIAECLQAQARAGAAAQPQAPVSPVKGGVLTPLRGGAGVAGAELAEDKAAKFEEMVAWVLANHVDLSATPSLESFDFDPATFIRFVADSASSLYSTVAKRTKTVALAELGGDFLDGRRQYGAAFEEYMFSLVDGATGDSVFKAANAAFENAKTVQNELRGSRQMLTNFAKKNPMLCGLKLARSPETQISSPQKVALSPTSKELRIDDTLLAERGVYLTDVCWWGGDFSGLGVYELADILRMFESYLLKIKEPLQKPNNITGPSTGNGNVTLANVRALRYSLLAHGGESDIEEVIDFMAGTTWTTGAAKHVRKSMSKVKIA